MSRPRLLDLFCGPGGATLGYERAGWDVTGVDIERWACYPGETLEADALAVLRGEVEGIDPREFDAIHASPPCHSWSISTNRTVAKHEVDRADWYSDLLTPTIALLEGLEVPYVVENVPGAGKVAGFDMLLCGTMFGNTVRRHRLFRFGFWDAPFMAPFGCAHERVQAGGNPYRSDVRQASGLTFAEAERQYLDGMGLQHVPVYAYEGRTQRGALEAIPPAYTEWIGTQLRAALEVTA